MTDAEIRKLLLDFRTGDEKAFDQIHDVHKNMLKTIISKFEYDYAELHSEAEYRFLEAAQKFDVENKAKFSTYAYNYVYSYLKNYLRRHAPIFCKRSGVGDISKLYYSPLDALDNTPAEDDIEEDTILKTMLHECVHDTLNDEEVAVMERFFGLGDIDEPVFNNTTGKREDVPVFNNKKGEWNEHVVSIEKKIGRIAKEMDRSNKDIKVIYDSAINKLKNSDMLKRLASEYLVTVREMQFMEA